MREELMKALKENDLFKDASIDEILRVLIEESSLSEVTACLDIIATESGTRVASFNWQGMTYPCGPGADLDIPAPAWKIDPTKPRPIQEDTKDPEILVQDPETGIAKDCGCVENEKGVLIQTCEVHNELNKDIVDNDGHVDYPNESDEKTEGGGDGTPTGTEHI